MSHLKAKQKDLKNSKKVLSAKVGVRPRGERAREALGLFLI